MPYYLDNAFLLDNPWITVVGCGGTGGFVAEGLCRLFQGRKATIVLVDHDRVESHNLLRQNFYAEDVGKFKSQALADRLARAYRRPVGYSVYPFRDEDTRPNGQRYPGLPAYGDSLIIGCADNAAARRAMAECLPGDPRRWLIDAGNDTNWGQVLVGNVAEPVTLEEPPFTGETCHLAPAPTLQRPDLLTAVSTRPPDEGIDTNLQGFVEAGAEERDRFFADARLVSWGLQQWERRSDKWDSDARQAALQQAKESQRVGTPATFSGLADSGPGLVAALCVRDHWEALSADDRQWCLETLIAEVENDCDTEEYIRQVANDPMRADRHSAYVLPKLLSNDPGNMTLLKAIAKATTHACGQVALWAAEGSGEYLGSEHEDLTLRGVGALAMQASLLNRLNKHRTPSNSQSIESQSAYSSAVQQVRDQVRDAFVAGAINVETELKELDLTSWTGMDASVSILAMLGKAPNTSVSRDFFVRAAQALVASWMTHHEERNSGRDFIRENAVMTRLAVVALALPPDAATYCCGPFLDAVEDHPSEVATFVDLLIAQEERSSSDKSSFWHVWQAFADRVLDTRWVSSIGSDYSAGSDLVDKLLFRVGWKEGVRRWHRLDGHEHRVDGFTTNLPVATTVLAAYASYLYTIGEGALPRAFMVVANQIETGDPNELLGDGNTVFCLESLLRRYVYAQPLLLRTEPDLRQAVLVILDNLVDAGSSAAYRMRDDFVTPLSSRQASG